MKALLIVPNIKSFDVMPSVSVACLKGFINEKTSHDAKIIDFAFHKKDWKNYLTAQINEEKPDLIGFTVLSFNFPEALEIARYIKEKINIKIIFGGVHVILSPQRVIENDVVDIICTGEGEFVLKELLDRSLDCKNIKGIWYKQNGKIIKNKNRRLIENLDDLPFSDFKDFELNKYFTLNHNHLPIMASRGCPYNCTFRGNHALKKKLEGKCVRFRTVDSVIEEIELRVQQFYNIPNPLLELPYHVSQFNSFTLKKIDLNHIFCNILNKKGKNCRKILTLIEETPHYKCLIGDKEKFQTYLDEFKLGLLSDNHSVKNLKALSKGFKYLEKPFQNCYILTIYANKTRRVFKKTVHIKLHLVF